MILTLGKHTAQLVEAQSQRGAVKWLQISIVFEHLKVCLTKVRNVPDLGGTDQMKAG